jgi:hypothetical protein
MDSLIYPPRNAAIPKFRTFGQFYHMLLAYINAILIISQRSGIMPYGAMLNAVSHSMLFMSIMDYAVGQVKNGLAQSIDTAITNLYTTSHPRYGVKITDLFYVLKCAIDHVYRLNILRRSHTDNWSNNKAFILALPHIDWIDTLDFIESYKIAWSIAESTNMSIDISSVTTEFIQKTSDDEYYWNPYSNMSIDISSVATEFIQKTSDDQYYCNPHSNMRIDNLQKIFKMFQLRYGLCSPFD